MHFRILIGCIAGLVPALAQAATVFSDGEFADSDWSAAFEIVDTSPNDSGAFTGAQSAAGGNPGSFREVSNFVNDFVAGGIGITGGHLKLAAVYDPVAQGAISSLDFALDIMGTSGPAGAMGGGYLIEQGGKYFGKGVTQALNGAGWQSRSDSGLGALSFAAFDGGTLDFSATGAAMTFGFYSSNGTFGNSLNIGGFDNWGVEITSAPTGAIPLPAGLPLLLGAVLTLGLLRRRQGSAGGA